MTTNLSRAMWVRSTAVAGLALFVAGCGGGGSDSSSSPSTSWIRWNGNANGTLVVDRSNDFFRVRASDGAVVDSQGRVLTGLTTNSSAAVLQNGKQIGSVAAVDSASGSKIAAFKCSSGSLMDIVLSTSTYTVSGCATSPADAAPVGAPTSTDPDSSDPNTPSRPTSADYSGIPASQCVSFSTAGGKLQVANSCPEPVQLVFCFTGNSSATFACGKNVVLTGLAGFESRPAAFEPSTFSEVIWMACKTGPSGVIPVPTLSPDLKGGTC